MEQGLPSLPNGWHKKQLGDVVKLSQGTQVPVGDQYLEQEDGLIRFLRISDFVRSDEPPRYILNPGSQYLVEADDICMIRYGDAGRAVTGLAGALANNLFKISPIESLLKRFLFLQLCSPRCVDYLRAANNSSTMPAISFKAVNAMEVSVAPLDEQKRIVEKLDVLLTRIDTAIEHLQESVTLADALYASLLDQAFNPKSPSSNEDGTNQLPNGWRKVPLGTIVELSQGTQIPVGDQFVEQDEGFIRFLRISDFVRYDEPPRYILYPGPQYIVQEDDVCMIRYGDAGRAVTGLAGALANNLFKISPNEMLSKRFLFLQLQSPRCVEYLRASNNSSTMPAISFKAVNAMEFNLPPLDEQQQIIEKLNNANKLYLALKGLFENKIRYFNDLKASILDSAFKGEL